MITVGLVVFTLIRLIIRTCSEWSLGAHSLLGSPAAMDLEIVEPPLEVEESRPAKRTLIYPVKVTVNPVVLPAAPADPPSPPPADDGRRRHGRRRPGPPPSAPARLGATRASVHERLGPHPRAAGHVEQRNSSLASASPGDIQGAAAVAAPDGGLPTVGASPGCEGASSDSEALEELPIEEEAGCMPDMPCASIQEATSMQCTNGAEDIEEVRPGDMGPSGMIAGAGGLSHWAQVRPG